MSEKNSNAKLDYSLLLIIILLAIISVFTLYTLDPYLSQNSLYQNMYLKQVVWYIAGSMAVAVIMMFDYDRFRQVSWLLYGIGVLSLLMLYFHFPPGIAKEVKGAWGWFEFPVLGTIQPAEFMKVFLIIFMAHVMVAHNEKNPEHTVSMDLWLLCKMGIIASIPIVLLIEQPDLGGVLVLIAITAFMVLVSGIKWRIILTLFSTFIIGLSTFIYLYFTYTDKMNQLLYDNGLDHVVQRFQGWLFPEEYSSEGAYQTSQAMLAIGSGQFFGKGIGQFEKTQYVPENHTDYIFTSISEQFGFFGSSVVILIFFLLIYRLVNVALKCKEPFASYMVTGIIGMFTYQVFQNIGMSLQLLPVTGLPLPFISYGGSSTLTYMIAIGIVLSVFYRIKTYMFDES
ncbi:cell division protein FtsW, lipid II flippase [Gracilibacillus orientalis]|uniref:Cell division protein FtsW, lipid II flippase n=1 Tax=Gracilibacillus orientalis TaxID=334253 RepID=A0A1I4H2N7_9BACI|nr:FtsW/RodA/SpoVE family cell cycle protein [Gracilibacillus orientalis]SFL36489.1 cell division protein FtsW, lipid II flippase [Gracilibacillus orientalis]